MAPFEEQLRRFCEAVRDREGIESVACLPLATVGTRDEAQVSELGVELARQVALGIEATGFEGWVLDGRELAMCVGDSNVEVSTLYSEADVASNGDRLGVEAIVFGSLQRRDVGRNRRELRGELWALDVAAGRTIARCPIVYSNTDNDARTAFDLAKRRSQSWSAGTGWQGRRATQDLQSELRAAARTAMNRVARSVDLEKYRVIYVPPTNVAALASRLARVQSGLYRVQQEKDLRAAARRNGDAVDEATITIDGEAFETLADAEGAVYAEYEALGGSEVFRFCGTITEMVIEELQEHVSNAQVKRDLGFTSLSENPLLSVEAWIAADSLARTRTARRRLADDGIHLILAPKLVRVGQHYNLRLTALDVVEEDLNFTVGDRVDARYADELDAACGERVARPGEVEKP